jgi:hypothetical protein
VKSRQVVTIVDLGLTIDTKSTAGTTVELLASP